MAQNIQQIKEGISYLRIMSHTGKTVDEVADDHMVPIEQVKKAIAAARAHKDNAQYRTPDVTFIPPAVRIQPNFTTGMRQIVTDVEVELLGDINVMFDVRKETEFIIKVPLKIKVKRQ